MVIARGLHDYQPLFVQYSQKGRKAFGIIGKLLMPLLGSEYIKDILTDVHSINFVIFIHRKKDDERTIYFGFNNLKTRSRPHRSKRN
jgi:hypothetical protein